MTPSKYMSCSFYTLIPEYKEPSELYGEWKSCSNCNLKPKVWIYDNGRSTGCGCSNNRYDHFSIHAECVTSVHKRTSGKGMGEYDPDALRKNWNHWVETSEILFEPASNRTDGKW